MQKHHSYLALSVILGVALVISLGINLSQCSNLKSAKSFSNTTSVYLEQTQKPCSADSSDFDGMSECVDALFAELHKVPVFMETYFVNYNPYSSLSQKGVFIILNIGKTSYDPSKFKLYLNKELQDNDGCELKAQVESGLQCALNFKRVCEPGDSLTVEYDSERVMVKSC
ncbi:MAG: hypothetical protein MUF61_03610 [archaeon]|jgi:hypothetical protein|nr:hypothetical protein [archaeon]